MASYLISDLGLNPDTPALNMRLLRQLAHWLGTIDALYIVGDLFACWVGDDDRHQAYEEICAAFKAFSAVTPIYLQAGSHDFLLGDEFAQRAGIHLLPPISLLPSTSSTQLLISGLAAPPSARHVLRRACQDASWQADFLRHSVRERKAILEQLSAQFVAHQTTVVGLDDEAEHDDKASWVSWLQSCPQPYLKATHWLLAPSLMHQSPRLARQYPNAHLQFLPSWQQSQGVYLILSDL